MGIKLFPFQHMAVKAMFQTDYFMGVWSRGMSKSFTTGVYAALDAVLNQGVEIGILSKSFRQAKMIFKKIEDIAAKPEAALFAQCITKKSKRLRFPRKNIYFYVVHVYMKSVKKERSYIYRECDKCILLQNYRMKIVV